MIGSLILHLAAHPSASAVASHLHASAVPTPGQTGQPTSSSSGDISALDSALIGVVAAIIGGLVSGWLTIVASSRQSRRERKDTRLERSKQAAMDIASAWPVLEEALFDRSVGNISADDLHKAFNTFSRTATMQSIPITDKTLRRHIRSHVTLVLSGTTRADDPEKLAPQIEPLRQSGDRMAEAIRAHYQDEQLPRYGGVTLVEPSSPAPARKTKRREFQKRQRPADEAD